MISLLEEYLFIAKLSTMIFNVHLSLLWAMSFNVHPLKLEVQKTLKISDRKTFNVLVCIALLFYIWEFQHVLIGLVALGCVKWLFLRLKCIRTMCCCFGGMWTILEDQAMSQLKWTQAGLKIDSAAVYRHPYQGFINQVSFTQVL